MKRKGFFSWVGALVFYLALLIPAFGYDGIDLAELRRLAEREDAGAQSKLGVMYATGVGVAMDKKEAAKWYGRSARQGYPLGEWNLAFLYLRGEGVPEDFGKARELLQKAADQGFVNAQYDLGMLYLLGVGVPADRAEGEKWLRKAASRGYPEAERMLKELPSS